MAQDISGVGLQLTLVTSVTFPTGLTITAFADDVDPLDIPDHVLAEAASGLNATLITWEKANPLEISFAVIPGSADDINLQVLAKANLIGVNKITAGDICDLTAAYPNGEFITWDSGKLMSAPLGSSVASSARMKSKKYVFKFESMN